jgi:hypothetical protein
MTLSVRPPLSGPEHWWFEGRGPRCTLLVYIDDATSRLMHLQFVESESTFDYFAATRAYLERYGKPVAFYSDKHGVFRVNKKDAIGGDGMTQFGRALHALNIDIICANSSQAKGRVERANGTLQDRLVKEMRLSGIDTIAAGNARPEESLVQGRIDSQPGVALRDLEASRDALLRSRYQPQPTERRLSCFPPRDISNWPKS